jgi:hypothetical protein
MRISASQSPVEAPNKGAFVVFPCRTSQNIIVKGTTIVALKQETSRREARQMRKAHLSSIAILICLMLQACAPDTLPGASPDSPRPSVEIGMAQYSPMMSSVPGYPFTCRGEHVASVTYIADNGEMLLWGPDDYKVKPQGKQVSVKAGETVYWSALTEAQETAAQASITVTIRMDGGKEYTRRISIEQTQESGYYKATVMN